MTPKKCPKCGIWIKHTTNFTRHVKHCGEKKYPCPDCKKLFSRKDVLKRHSKKAHPQRTSTKEFVSKECEKAFSYESTLRLHEKTCGKPTAKPFCCSFPGCGKSFAHKSNFNHHKKYAHQVGGGSGKRKREEEEEPTRKKPKLPDTVKQVYKADKEVSTLKGLKVDAFFYPKTETQRMDQQVFFKDTLPRLKLYLEKVLKEKTGIKWNLMYHCSLSMPDKYRDVPLKHSPYIRTPFPMTSTHPDQVLEQLNMAMEMVEERMSTFMQAGSGWVLEENHALVLEMVEYAPIGGSSYLELPVDISHTKAVINLQNEDQQCFMGSILAALHPATHHAERISYYQPFKDELNFSGLTFPITIDQISKFEKLNPTISTTVIGCEEKTIAKGVKKSHLFPLRVPDVKKENHITLLHWGKGSQYHYAWVKNLNRLLYNTKSYKGQTFFCERCFQGFIRLDLLEKHSENCQSIPIQAVNVVKEKISFKSWAKMEETLFRVYADFECILQECEECPGKTTRVQQHVPCSVAWVLISDHPEVTSRSMLFRPSSTTEYSTEELSDQVIDTLMTSLQALEEELLPYQEEVKPMILSKEEEAQFQAATHCYMCKEPFQAEKENLKKVRDHNHATGEYRWAAHFICNLNKRRSKHIPMFFNNLRGYDAHLIMRGIHRHAGKKQIKVIPNNMEKYVSFQLGSLRFLDSLQFLGPGASLEALVGNLTEFPHLYKHFPQVWSLNVEELQLLSQKGV